MPGGYKFRYKPRRRMGKAKATVVTSKGVRTLPSVAAANRLTTVAMVKRMIGKSTENKMAGRRIMNNQSLDSVPTSPFPVLPQVSQGTQDYQRIGESISPKGLYIKADMGIAAGTSSDNRPITARVMVLSLKAIKNEQFLSAGFGAQIAKLLKYNDITSGIIELPYGTQPFSNLPPINKDLFTVHADKRIKLYPVNTQEGSASHEVRLGQLKRFSCKVKLPSTLHFDAQDGGWGNVATNACPFMIIGYEYSDGLPGDFANAEVKLLVNAHSFLYYEDA